MENESGWKKREDSLQSRTTAGDTVNVKFVAWLLGSGFIPGWCRGQGISCSGVCGYEFLSWLVQGSPFTKQVIAFNAFWEPFLHPTPWEKQTARSASHSMRGRTCRFFPGVSFANSTTYVALKLKPQFMQPYISLKIPLTSFNAFGISQVKWLELTPKNVKWEGLKDQICVCYFYCSWGTRCEQNEYLVFFSTYGF